MAAERWFRYSEVFFAEGFGFDDEWPRGYSVSIVLREYNVLRRTLKGVWLDMRIGDFSVIGKVDQRFVLLDARKRFACPTTKEAMESFKTRKRREIGIYAAHLARARRVLEAAERHGVP